MWVFLLASLGWAADWPMLQGTEPADAAPVRVWGFAQALAEGLVGAKPVTGLVSEGLLPYEGEVPTFNRIGSGDATWGLSVRRARLGVRGAVPKTSGRLGYLLAAEFGANALTREDPVVLTDASVSISYIPGVRLRIGKFKLPLGEEALEMNPAAAQFVSITPTTAQLLGENRVVDGAYVGGFSGYRDLAVQAFDTFAVGSTEISYALALSNGAWAGTDDDNGKDVTGRVSWVPWRAEADDHGVRREEVRLWMFWQQGQRMLDGVRYDRIRRGGGASVLASGVQARVEVVQASGMIELGAQPPFANLPVMVAGEGEAIGGNAAFTYRRGKMAGGLRYDGLARRYDSDLDLRVFHTGTVNLTVEPDPRVRVMLDYDLRLLGAPRGSGDAQAIGRAMSDRLSLQVTALF
ncbi:MAG: hypothetical protein RLZZ383_3055 [Pseudomonadota bacterium]